MNKYGIDLLCCILQRCPSGNPAIWTGIHCSGSPESPDVDFRSRRAAHVCEGPAKHCLPRDTGARKCNSEGTATRLEAWGLLCKAVLNCRTDHKLAKAMLMIGD